MRTLLIGVFGGLVLAACATAAQAAPNVVLLCPTQAHAVVTHNGDDSWVATNQGSGVTGRRVETIAGQPSLVCTYHMFGADYWIYRRPQADFPNCQISDRVTGFYCLH
ncbi:MAG: hypothetical protein ABIQ30_03150 [Devosia sp.]